MAELDLDSLDRLAATVLESGVAPGLAVAVTDRERWPCSSSRKACSTCTRR